jgi:hypothetical protein
MRHIHYIYASVSSGQLSSGVHTPSPPPHSRLCAFYVITERISDEKHTFSLQEAADYGGWEWGDASKLVPPKGAKL